MISNIIISRTDSIGDVVLTLPVAAVLKQHIPGIKIGFMGKAYTRPVIEACTFIDDFIDVDDFFKGSVTINGQQPQAILHVLPVPTIAKKAKQLKIPLRIGTTNRLYHWFTCNKLVKLSRKKSDLHEAQLNIKLLAALGIKADYTLNDIFTLFGLHNIKPLDTAFKNLLEGNKYNLIFHAKSQGNGREWPLDNFIALAKLLDKNRFNIFISGTDKEKAALQPLLAMAGDNIIDITGKMDLYQFMAFINAADGLIASGTGPLHIAAALGKHAYGLFPPMRPIHPGRWQPIGPGAQVFVLNKNCTDCKGNAAACQCIKNVAPGLLATAISNNAAQIHK
jgi:heptosyltransferase-3